MLKNHNKFDELWMKQYMFSSQFDGHSPMLQVSWSLERYLVLVKERDEKVACHMLVHGQGYTYLGMSFTKRISLLGKQNKPIQIQLNNSVSNLTEFDIGGIIE